MGLQEFRDKVWEYRRQAGFTQIALADALGLHPKVLSQKLNGSSGYSLNHPEIKQLIKTLAGWEAITTRTEAFDLLAAMGLKDTTFTSQEWATPPLDKLEASPVTDGPGRSNYPSLPSSITNFIGREW